MSEQELNSAIIEFLYDLHARNVLNLYIINSISRNFKVNALEICENEGITFIIS